MNENLVFILIAVLFSFIIFILSITLIKKLKINHPKNRFGIYAVLMISIIFISLFSLTVVGNLQNKIKTDDSLMENNEEKVTLVVVIDETQSKNKNNSSSNNFANKDSKSYLNTNSENEINDESSQKVTFSFINSIDDLRDIISQIRSRNIHSSINIINKGLTSDENNFPSAASTSNHLIDDKSDNDLDISFIFYLFNLILIILSITYILFCLFFGKKIILKSINADKCQNSKVLQIVNKLCKEIKIKTPDVYIFNGEPNAFIFGYPVTLVISKNLIKYLSKEELNIAIRHELAHISNKDHILKPLLQTIRILFFYNPIIHLLYKKMIEERELLADSKFISTKVEKIKFMEMLFKINNLRKNKYIYSKKLYELTSLSLLSHKVKKLKITNRFNNLFSYNKKKSFITTLICLIVLFSNISVISLTQNNFLNDSIKIDGKIETESLNDNINDNTNGGLSNSNTIYILRLIQKNNNELDLVLIEETF